MAKAIATEVIFVHNWIVRVLKRATRLQDIFFTIPPAMHIEEPATYEPEALLSMQDSQSFPESKDLSQENLALCQCSEASLQIALQHLRLL
jgi:uncharacterized protein (DUF2132 family)